jgi:23S rRNA (cytidine1920-2'-O)/16S rRNA (cytidine1409-2'-O)-methyltransferase
LADSRAHAAEAVASGRVTVGGAPTTKPSRLVAPGEPIELLGHGRRFVSRGGDKLDAALDEFGIDVRGARSLDAGASTGGFTDCMLKRGAAHVIAVDVGHGQLHERLVADQRVEQRDRTNARSLDADVIGEPVDVVVADLSFISLRVVAPALLACARPGADLVLLVKPQFESTRQEAAKGKGVIRDEGVRARVLDEVIAALAALGAAIMGTMVSPLTGADGNIEYFVHARKL